MIVRYKGNSSDGVRLVNREGVVLPGDEVELDDADPLEVGGLLVGGEWEAVDEQALAALELVKLHEAIAAERPLELDEAAEILEAEAGPKPKRSKPKSDDGDAVEKVEA